MTDDKQQDASTSEPADALPNSGAAGHELQGTSADHPESSPEASEPAEDQSQPRTRPLDGDTFDPTNPGEFDPSVVLLHLERDGVVVEGYINPYNGNGCRGLLVALADQLMIARSRGEGAAPSSVKVTVGAHPDPNALRRQRAAAAGHEFDPETGRCIHCGNAEWWCLDGNPCVPRSVDVSPPEGLEPAPTDG